MSKEIDSDKIDIDRRVLSMKIFPYNDIKAKKYGNSYEPLKDSVIIIIVGILLLTFSSIISFKYNLLILTIITLVILIVGVILATISFTSKKNIDLSALVIDDDKLLIIKVNPLAKKKDLDNLKDKYMKKTRKSINKLMQDDKFITYLIDNIDNIDEFEIIRVLNIYSEEIRDKKITLTCDLYDLKNKIIKYSRKVTILNAYSRQTEVYKFIKNYKNQDKYNMDINKVNKKRYDDLFVKNIKNLEFWLLCSLVFTFLIIIFKLTIPFICTIPFYAEIMTFALTLSCYDPANDTNYVGSSKPQNYIKIAIASFIVSLLVCFVWW
ncbi:MAG: hypothetical protein LKJ84_02495 [Bacilli bacterium]|nr:hypothetical protein [Bacilli bacterium]